MAAARGAGARLAIASGPGTRAGHALAYHAGAGAICLVGGDSGEVEVTRENPWFWDGRGWSRRVSGSGPPVASLVTLAGDLERRSVLAFGGFSVLGPKRYGPPGGDLWELRADLTWHRWTGEGPQPGPRHHHASAFDTRRGRLVLYGGIDTAEQWPTDVWEWDRERWHRIQCDEGPGERAHHAMAYDEARGRVVLRGGGRRNREHPTDTWEWDGTRWHRAAAEGPGPDGGYRMAYDAARRVVVLFGGSTCAWDGQSWRRLDTPRAPVSRMVHALAYDPARQRVVLYGGSVDRQNAADTWEWDGSSWTEMRPDP
jgi:hypothetical protein